MNVVGAEAHTGTKVVMGLMQREQLKPVGLGKMDQMVKMAN